MSSSFLLFKEVFMKGSELNDFGVINLLEAINAKAAYDYTHSRGKEHADAISYFEQDPYGVLGSETKHSICAKLSGENRR